MQRHRSLRLAALACLASLALAVQPLISATAAETPSVGDTSPTAAATPSPTPAETATPASEPEPAPAPSPTPAHEATPSPAPTETPEPDHTLHIDEDLPRFDFATGARLDEAPAVVPYADAGFAVLSGVRSNAFRYELRLIAGSEAYRGYVASAAGELNAAGLASFTLAPGQFPDPGATLPANTIYIGAATTSPCGSGGGIAGCGGPYLGQSRAVSNSGAIVLAGRVWILPPTALQSAAAQREIVAHELGHALGLAHYSGIYAGTQQVMYPSVSTIPAYQAGDRNGFAYLRGEAPRGYVDSINISTPSQVTISGWAFDPDQAAAATVNISIGGRAVGSTTTTLSRADVRSLFGVTGNRGFTITVPAPAGLQSICVTVTDYPVGIQQMITCVSAIVTSAQPTGYIDSIAQSTNRTVTATGWVLDRNQADPSDVTLTIDGSSAATKRSDILRADVNTALQTSGNHGYSITAPVTAGAHRFCIVTPDYPSLTPVTIGCQTLTITDSPPQTYIDTFAQASELKVNVTGWAFDRDTLAPSEVTLLVDGNAVATTTTTLPRADVNRAFGVVGNRGFSVTGPSLSPGSHTVCLRTPNYPDLTPVTFGCRSVTIVDHAPRSYVDTLMQTDGLTITATGWSFDVDASGPSEVTLSIDGVDEARSETTLLRNDVNAAFSVTGNRGFRLSTTASAGNHTVCLSTTDYPTLAQKTIQCQSVSVVDQAPRGYIDTLTASLGRITATGWAFDRDYLPSSTVTLTVDGSPAATITTSIVRPDVNASLQTSGARGFSISADVTPGSHTICLTTPDYPTNTPTTFGCRTVTTS